MALAAPGTLAGSFFGGIVTAVIVGGIATFIYKRRFLKPYTPVGATGGSDSSFRNI